MSHGSCRPPRRGEEADMNHENLFPFQTLDIYSATRELALRVHQARIRDRELRDQATRASKSCFLCLCEGLPNEGAALRHKYFVQPRNSLAETVVALNLAPSIYAVPQDDSHALHPLGTRIHRILTPLMHSARSVQLSE